jgi:hypothetical protein
MMSHEFKKFNLGYRVMSGALFAKCFVKAGMSIQKTSYELLTITLVIVAPFHKNIEMFWVSFSQTSGSCNFDHKLVII